MANKNLVFNEEATAHITGHRPLFFGEEPSLYDSVNKPYPKLYDLMENLKKLDWSPDDVDLTQTRMDLLKCSTHHRDLMLYNLAYQWSLDSIATSIGTLFAPFITNSELGHLYARISENEMLHSDTYSNIVRQCIPDPQEVFDIVFKNEQILKRSKVITRVLSGLKVAGAEYTLGLRSIEECKPIVLKGIVAVYALERVSFMASFANTFALSEQGMFVGAARLVQKILLDEMIHFESQSYVLTIAKSTDFAEIFEELKDELSEIVMGVVEQEYSWNKYLFTEGRLLVGLNEGILNEWVRYNAQKVFDTLGIKPPFRVTRTCPLEWFESNWMNLNDQQNANMESDNTNYETCSISRDIDEVSLDLSSFHDLLDFKEEEPENKVLKFLYPDDI